MPTLNPDQRISFQHSRAQLLRNSRIILFACALGLCSLLLGLGLSAGGVPLEAVFRPSATEAEFVASLRTFLWWAAAINLLILIALFLTAKCWLGTSDTLSPNHEREVDPPENRGRKLTAPLAQVVISALLAMVLLAILAVPRLSQSLWNDELWSLSESIHGPLPHELVENAPADEPVPFVFGDDWQSLQWKHAVWKYESTNHHFLLNLMAKTGLTVWQLSSGAEEWEFSETALRFLPFLCGLAGILAWAIVFFQLGFARAATLLPWLLALHPSYLQHASEMRGYPLVFLFLPLTISASLKALQGGRWRWWLSYAGAQFLLLYSWPGAGVIVVVYNLCLLAAIWLDRPRSVAPFRANLIKRWLIANLACAMVLFLLVAPCIFQIGPYLQSELVHLPMEIDWFQNYACRFFIGSDWVEYRNYSEKSELYIAGEILFAARPILFVGMAILIGAGAIAGLIKLLRRKPVAGALLGIGLCAPMVITFLSASSQGVFVFHWYYVYALPWAVGLAAIGITEALACLAKAIRHQPSATGASMVGNLAGVVATILILIGYAALAAPKLAALRSSSQDPRRESVRAVRGALDPTDPRNDGILSAHVFRNALAYDPLGFSVEHAAGPDDAETPGLMELMRLADTLQLKLFVNVGMPSEARKQRPEVMGVIEESGYFEQHSIHPGLEPQFERIVYRYKGGFFDWLSR